MKVEGDKLFLRTFKPNCTYIYILASVLVLWPVPLQETQGGAPYFIQPRLLETSPAIPFLKEFHLCTWRRTPYISIKYHRSYGTHYTPSQRPTANAPNSWSHTVITLATLRDKIVFRLSERPESPPPDGSPSWLLVECVWRKCANAALVLRHDSFPPRGSSVIHIHESDVGELVGTGRKKKGRNAAAVRLLLKIFDRMSRLPSRTAFKFMKKSAAQQLHFKIKSIPHRCLTRLSFYWFNIIYIPYLTFLAARRSVQISHSSSKLGLMQFHVHHPGPFVYFVCLLTLRVFCNSPAGRTCQSWSRKDEVLKLNFYYERSKLRDTFPNFLPPTLPDAFARPNTAPGSGRCTAPCRPLWGGVALEKWGIMRFPQQRFENKLREG